MSINKKTVKALAVTAAILATMALMYAAYLFYMPHRDIKGGKTDAKLSASALVSEYLASPDAANNKYLDEEGESNILEVTGVVADISEDFNKQVVVLLKSPGDKAGVSCTFTDETNHQAKTLSPGSTAVIKGVIRAGAAYDEDLGMYLDAVVEKCSLVQ